MPKLRAKAGHPISSRPCQAHTRRFTEWRPRDAARHFGSHGGAAIGESLSDDAMGVYELLLIVSVVLILFVARQMSGEGCEAAQDPPPTRRIYRALLAILAFVALGLLYAGRHAH